MRNLFILIALMFAFPGQSSSADWLGQYVHQQLCQTTLAPSQRIPGKFLHALMSSYRAYLRQAKADAPEKIKALNGNLHIRDVIPFRGAELPVLEVLGVGSSGVFYAVETPEGVRTAEEFFDPEVARRVGSFQTRSDLHVYDRDGAFVLQEFVLGLPEANVSKAEALQALGVRSPVFAREIAKWMRARFTDRKTHDRDDVLIEIPSGRVVQLFPYPDPAHERHTPPLLHEPHDPIPRNPRTTMDYED